MGNELTLCRNYASFVALRQSVTISEAAMPLAALFARPQFTSAQEQVAELELPGGRRLSYATFGAGDGPLVVVLDGPGSRGLARAASAAAADLGLRLVAPDRPGFGTSTQVRGYRIADWPRDQAALLDALGVRRARPRGARRGHVRPHAALRRRAAVRCGQPRVVPADALTLRGRGPRAAG
jgi:hypothetical protein